MQVKFSKEKNTDAHLRENYESPNHSFADWVHNHGFEKTWAGTYIAHLENRYHIRKYGLFLLFSILLAYTLNLEIQTPINYKMGDIARTDIISPLSFEIVDEVTTEDLRTKAELSVPLLFDYDPKVFERVSARVYESFRAMRTEIKKIHFPKAILQREEKIKEFFVFKNDFEKLLGVPVPDYTFEWLAQNRFAARIENILIRNLSQWYQKKIVEGIERNIPSQLSQLSSRQVQQNAKGKEFLIQKSELRDSSLPEQFELSDFRGLDHSPDRVKKGSKDSKESEEEAFIVGLARKLVYPNLTINVQDISSRRKQARDSVLPVVISVKKNQTIVDEGSPVLVSKMALLKEIEHLRSDKRSDLLTLAMGFLFFGLIFILLQYMRRFNNNKLPIQVKDFLVMGLITLFVVLMTKFFWFTTEKAFVSKFGSLLPSTLFLFATPVAAGPMLVGLLIPAGEVVWVFSVFLAIVMGFMTEMNFSFVLICFAGGIAGARGVFNCKKRNDIYWAGLRCGVVNAVVISLTLTITRMDQSQFGRELLLSVPAGLLGGILSSLVAMMAVPLLESVFRYTTDVKLLELSNLNHPLLRDMIVKSPGTYHHSMMVGSMVEAAAEEIGANALLGKVMSYYHDIGKMEHANYFIENQKPGSNPHDHISPYLSKTLLVAHVKDGVEMGIKYKLGQPIIDGIVQHHGTTLISYFYNKALDLRQEGDPEISEEEFRYPGPKPQFREAALCMLADSIEAAARSLDEPTPVRLQNIVKNILQRKFMESQLDECNLSLKDLAKVERAFTKILLGIYHQRIDYPKSAGGGTHDFPVQNIFSKFTSGR